MRDVPSFHSHMENIARISRVLPDMHTVYQTAVDKVTTCVSNFTPYGEEQELRYSTDFIQLVITYYRYMFEEIDRPG